MNIKIIAVGKIKEKFFSDAIDEYMKRMKRFARIEIVQINDRKIPDGASLAQEAEIVKKEGEDVLSKITPQQYVIALCVEGEKMDSVLFSKKISSVALSGKSDIAFVIGGSLGLSDEVKKRADMRLSFSDMTFPHQLMRVILLEQIYRAFKIASNETYHK